MNDNFSGAIGTPIIVTPSTNNTDADPITTPVDTNVATDPLQMGNTSLVQTGMTDMNNIVQSALRNYSMGIQQQRSAQMQQLGTIESGMYDQMGRAQLASERDIANRRMQALRSGMPSSQLAALELQNVQTAQLGAQQMAQQYDELRMQLGTELAGAEATMEGDLTRDMLQGRIDMEAIDAQRYASDIGQQVRDAIGEEAFDGLNTFEQANLLRLVQGFDPVTEKDDPTTQRDAENQLRDLDTWTSPRGASIRLNEEMKDTIYTNYASKGSFARYMDRAALSMGIKPGWLARLPYNNPLNQMSNIDLRDLFNQYENASLSGIGN